MTIMAVVVRAELRPLRNIPLYLFLQEKRVSSMVIKTVGKTQMCFPILEKARWAICN